MGMFIDTLNFVAVTQGPVGGTALSSIGPKQTVWNHKRPRRAVPTGALARASRNHPAQVQAVAGLLAIFGGGRGA